MILFVCVCVQYSAEANKQLGDCEQAEHLGAVDVSLRWVSWIKCCCVSDEQSPDSQYVDLLLNPERFTGYKGPEAWQIWNSIYEENCFKPYTIKRPIIPDAFHIGSGSEAKTFYSWLEGQCVEKRAFYRLISGLHSSINIHLSARYLLDDSLFQSKWGHNVSEFRQRFDSELTAGEGPKRLRNLYFLYLIELRALAKALPFFQQPSFHLYTGRPEEDQKHKELLLHILQLARSFPLHFDETSLFAGDEIEAAKLKEDIRLAFLNISRIMDCVGCFKCRLWGKLQTQGLGTSLKILFSERQIEALPTSSHQRPGFQLSRQEVVSLLNAFGRISTSIRELKNFRSLLAEEQWRCPDKSGFTRRLFCLSPAEISSQGLPSKFNMKKDQGPGLQMWLNQFRLTFCYGAEIILFFMLIQLMWFLDEVILNNRALYILK